MNYLIAYITVHTYIDIHLSIILLIYILYYLLKLPVKKDSVDRVATGSHVLKFSRLQHVSNRIQKQNIKIVTISTHMVLNVGACDTFTL
jgi:hypothetical protein